MRVPFGASFSGRFSGPIAGLAASGAVLALATLVLATVFDERHITNVSLVYLLLTLVAAALWGYRVGLLVALVADLAVNFFFVTPLHTLTVQETRNVVALVIFLAVAFIGASMLALLRREALRAEARRQEAAALLDLAQEMAGAPTPRVAVERLCFVSLRVLHAKSVSVLRERPSGWAFVASTSRERREPTRDEVAIARSVAENHEIARSGGVRSRGRGPASEPATYLPLGTRGGRPAVLQVIGRLRPPPLVEADRLLDAFANEAALALDRARLAEEASEADVLKRADELKTVLLSSVSHDLRSPLTAIKAAVGNLRDTSVEWQPEDTTAFLEVIEMQTDRLAATVDGLLQMSRLEGGVVRPVLEPIEAGPLLADVAVATAPVTAGRPIEQDVPLGTWLRADYALLMQALVNLVENAAKYSTPGAPIRMAVEQPWPIVRISVIDAGPAIPAEDLPRIFEKFYRGSTGSGTKGTGLGLAIVQKMVELCGGKVHVDATASGNRFTIELPAVAAPER